MLRLFLLFAASLLAPMFLSLGSQSVRIAIEVSEEGDRRTIEAALVSAFRQVPLVEVVSGSEYHQYVVSAIAICDPDCITPTEYSISLRLFERNDPEGAANGVLYFLNDTLSQSGLPLSERENAIIRASLERYFHAIPYQQSHVHKLFVLGRNVYERRLREVAREFDTSCFERSRMYQRYHQATGEAKSRIIQEIVRRDWAC